MYQRLGGGNTIGGSGGSGTAPAPSPEPTGDDTYFTISFLVITICAYTIYVFRRYYCTPAAAMVLPRCCHAAATLLPCFAHDRAALHARAISGEPDRIVRFPDRVPPYRCTEGHPATPCERTPQTLASALAAPTAASSAPPTAPSSSSSLELFAFFSGFFFFWVDFSGSVSAVPAVMPSTI